jgi:hypothetical protein
MVQRLKESCGRSDNLIKGKQGHDQDRSWVRRCKQVRKERVRNQGSEEKREIGKQL